mmetsp:Transcript_27789/g.93417  ORF Transcript_27789/g.93417 Transcript_27789/m.93417 type:complete len:361 (-) Transcript_27789:490-1572(-)
MRSIHTLAYRCAAASPRLRRKHLRGDDVELFAGEVGVEVRLGLALPSDGGGELPPAGAVRGRYLDADFSSAVVDHHGKVFVRERDYRDLDLDGEKLVAPPAVRRPRRRPAEGGPGGLCRVDEVGERRVAGDAQRMLAARHAHLRQALEVYGDDHRRRHVDGRAARHLVGAPVRLLAGAAAVALALAADAGVLGVHRGAQRVRAGVDVLRLAGVVDHGLQHGDFEGLVYAARLGRDVGRVEVLGVVGEEAAEERDLVDVGGNGLEARARREKTQGIALDLRRRRAPRGGGVEPRNTEDGHVAMTTGHFADVDDVDADALRLRVVLQHEAEVGDSGGGHAVEGGGEGEERLAEAEVRVARVQ